MSAKHCTTHHHACDCREAAHAAELASLRERVSELEQALAAASRVREGMVTIPELIYKRMKAKADRYDKQNPGAWKWINDESAQQAMDAGREA